MWENVSKEENLSEDFMREHAHTLNWKDTSLYKKMSKEFIYEMGQYVYWKNIVMFHPAINEMLSDAIENRKKEILHTTSHSQHTIAFQELSFNSHLNKENIFKYTTMLNWNILLFENTYVKNEMAVGEYRDCVYWEEAHKGAIRFKEINMEFLKKHKDYLHWDAVTEYLLMKKFDFPVSFIEEYKEYINWKVLLKKKEFSIEFLKRYQQYLNWDIISKSQNLSEEFMEQFSNRLNWYLISVYQNLSFSFVKKHIHKMHIKDLKLGLIMDFTASEWEELEKRKIKKTIQSMCFDIVFICRSWKKWKNI